MPASVFTIPRRPRPSIRADVFPATFTLTDPASGETREINRVRVVVTLDRVTVFQDSSSGPTIVFSERLEDFTPAPRASRNRHSSLSPASQATTDSGKQLQFHKAGGCGCGSRLKSFDPFPSISQFSSTQDVQAP